MKPFRKASLRWAAPLLLVTLAGCGSGDASVVKVTGTLNYKGHPVPNVYVDFIPEQGRPSWGVTDDQGQFTLKYDRKQDGAVVGKHKVSARPGPQTSAASVPGKTAAQPRDLAEFFDKYSSVKSKEEVVIDKNSKEVTLDWK